MGKKRWIMPLGLHGAYINYYYVLKLQVPDGVIRSVLFAESSPILCQAWEGEGRVGGSVNCVFF